MKKLLATTGFALLFGCSQEEVQTVQPTTPDSGLVAELSETDPSNEVATPAATDEPTVTTTETSTEPAPEPATDTSLNAETVLADAIAMAARDNRRVFVHLGAPW